MFLKINGVTHYLWRAVDQNGVVLDILVQPGSLCCHRFFRKLLRGTGRRPRVIVTDKLGSYAAAKRMVMPGVAHRQHRYLNNRAENSHQPTRERERRMRHFKSAGHAQRFVEVHGIIASHFRPRRHLLSATAYRGLRTERFQRWNEVTGTTALGQALPFLPKQPPTSAAYSHRHLFLISIAKLAFEVFLKDVRLSKGL